MKKLHNRDIASFVQKDLNQKMVFIGGPRQTGKSTLAKSFLKHSTHYLSWDVDEDRENIIRTTLPTNKGILVFDEIHKYSRWRNLVKGIYDKHGEHLKIIVTGSAKLDYYRRGGDSLQGRYHYYRLHPLTLFELKSFSTSTLNDLLNLSGFPEPFFLGSELEARRWSRNYRTRLIREEITSLEDISDLALLERLMLRLPELVGSPLSINSLREDLNLAHSTVARWVDILERLYAIYRLYPFGTKMIRAVKKEAKHYHFDWTLVADAGARFENLVAGHLLKWCHFIEDTQGYDMELRYFRDTAKREVDFVILKNQQPIYFVEAKLKATESTDSLRYLARKWPKVESAVVGQVSKGDFRDRDGIRVCTLGDFLQSLSI